MQAIFNTIKRLMYWLKTVVQGGVKRLTVVQNADRCANSFAQRYLIDISIQLEKTIRPLCKARLDRCALCNGIYIIPLHCVTVILLKLRENFSGGLWANLELIYSI